METRIVLTGILKANDLYLVVKRNDNDDLFPRAWEFPGGHLEDNENIFEGLKRELKEEIGYDLVNKPIITNYSDNIKNNIHKIELDFIINVNKDDINVILSDVHSDYKGVTKDSDLLDDFIKSKINN
jgi:8-oxo-dGTP diphosphatase